jgi:hypothetical protein
MPNVFPDLAARVELRPDPTAPKGNVIPALARLLRKLRDRERTKCDDSAGGNRDERGD